MQLFVARKREGEWRLDAVLNARRLTLGRQVFLDELDALSDPARRQVGALVATLHERERTGSGPA
jgi:hypothetical protein